MGAKAPTAEQEKNRDIELKNFFVDREEHRHRFKSHLLKLKRTGINPNGMVLIYSGVGGIGKTLLLKEFEKLANEQDTKFVRYDFKDSIDMLYALKTLRQKLYGDYGIEIPLFDKGCIYLAQKDGFVSSEQEKAVLKSSSMFRSFKKNFSLSNTGNDIANAISKVGKIISEDNELVLVDWWVGELLAADRFITYDNKRREGKKPSIADFGQNLQQVIERAVNSFDVNSLALLQKLCILGRWTNEIFRAVIPDYNPNIYRRLKSILTEESFADFGDGKQEKIYSFDRTISSFLLLSLRQDEDFSNYFTNIRDKANAYFQCRLASVRRWQNRIKEALELAEAAYSKVKDLPLSKSERPFKIQIMQGLAEVLSELQRYADEIKLLEEMVDEYKRYMPDGIDRIIDAKYDLMYTLYRGWADDSARRIEDLKRRIESFDKPNEETVKLIELCQAMLALIENKPDVTIEEIIEAKKDLASECRFEEDLTDAQKAEVNRLFEELEEYYRQNLPASREDLLEILSDYSDFIEYHLKNIPAAVKKREEIIALLESDSETPAIDILDLMSELAELSWRNAEEELSWREQIFAFCKENFVEDAPETPAALKNLASVYRRLKDYEKAKHYVQELVAVEEKNLDPSHIEVIETKQEFADIFHGDYKIKLLKEIIEDYKDYLAENQPEKIDEIQEKIDVLTQDDEPEEQPTEIDASESLRHFCRARMIKFTLTKILFFTIILAKIREPSRWIKIHCTSS